jgi:hypothetical protein
MNRNTENGPQKACTTVAPLKPLKVEGQNRGYHQPCMVPYGTNGSLRCEHAGQYDLLGKSVMRTTLH